MNQYRKSPRARFLDYDNGEYFVTICTKDKKHYFGEILNSKMMKSAIGFFVEDMMLRCTDMCPKISIPMYVIMPNHIHMIVSIDQSGISNGFEQRSPNPSLRANQTSQRHVPILSKYISSFKGSVTKYAKSIGVEFGWHARYHDHMIRGCKDGNNIGEYIRNNVGNWQNDCFNNNSTPPLGN